MKTEYEFYEIVMVNTDDPDKIRINNLKGAILGKSQDEKGKWGYAVHIYELNECWDFMHNELKPTGEFDKEESFYDGTTIKVPSD